MTTVHEPDPSECDGRPPIAKGTVIPPVEQRATLRTSVAYAGASGDLNPLHYDAVLAAAISPTGAPIAHGMFGMGLVSRAVVAFAGGAEAVRDLQVRFTRPWPLGVTATFGGTVNGVEDGIATVALWGRTEDGTQILRGTARIAI